MRLHEFEGDAFCVALIEGTPCLGERNDKQIHVQPVASRGKSVTEIETWMFASTQPGYYLLVTDRARWGRYYGGVATMTLPQMIVALEGEQKEYPDWRFWVERNA